MLESVHSERPGTKSATKFEHKAVNKFNSFQKRPFAGYALNSNLVNCHFCKGNHKLYTCEKLKELPVASRIQEIKNLKLCTIIKYFNVMLKVVKFVISNAILEK